jgi:hypothetical protein
MCDRQIIQSQTNLQTHLWILQGIINRMAGNSGTCKTLCVTLVAAICAVAASANNPKILLISVLPVVIFCLLDIYYLSLERGFRLQYNSFVEKLHRQELSSEDFFVIKSPDGYSRFSHCIGSFKSWSIYIAYPGVLLVVGVIFFAIK